MKSPHVPRPARIVVRIEELIVDGVPPGDRHAIADAVRTALAQRLEQGGAVAAWSASAQIDRIDAGECRLPRHSRADSLGTRIGESIYRGITTWPTAR